LFPKKKERVEPLYKCYAWDIKRGFCREVGIFRRLFSIVVIILDQK